MKTIQSLLLAFAATALITGCCTTAKKSCPCSACGGTTQMTNCPCSSCPAK